MVREKDVTVVIPTYFANQFLYNCINSINNYSPGTKILTFKNDIGWLKAANELMKSVTTDVILMNDDTVFVSDVVSALQATAYAKKDIGIVGGKSLDITGEYVNNYGIYVAPDGNTAHKYFGKPKNEINKPEIQQAVEGSCMYIKREIILKVGYFDEIYGMGYREEVDYAFRVRQAGYRVVSSPDAEYIHLVSQTNARLGIHNDTYDLFMERWGQALKEGKV